MSAGLQLGPHINTIYDEESPYMHVDGSTVYFSSKGHNTMGEFDVYRSTYNADGMNSQSRVIWISINTVRNDVSLF